MPDRDFSFISGQQKLGPFAAEMGARLGWGKSAGDKEASCSMGRLGFAVFDGKQFPAMLLWITVSGTAAYTWTWIGPDQNADEAKQALQIVVGATEAKNPVSPRAS